MRHHALFLIASAILLAACTPTNRAQHHRVDALFAEWNKPGSPGCSVGISHHGKVLYERGYGAASLELSVPITPASVLPAASISKMFTAFAILLLSQDGKINLDAPVEKYIPEWTSHGTSITVRNLLSHASGLPDAFLLEGMSPPDDSGADRNDRILRVLLKSRGLNFAPGTDFQYNNGGYTLLAIIVKRVSGKPFPDFVNERIFKPLGMTSSHFHSDDGLVVPNRVNGYHKDDRGYRVSNEYGGVVGNAGLQTTSGDLLKWLRNFSTAQLGSRKLVDLMQTPVIQTHWSEFSRYGMGVEVSQYRGQTTISHGGGDRGIAAYAVHYPKQDFDVALLCNLDNIGDGGTVTRLTQKIAEIYIPDAFAEPERSYDHKPASIPLDQLNAWNGLYLDRRQFSVGRIYTRDGKLRASLGASPDPSFELIPITNSRFYITGTPIELAFHNANSGKVELHVSGPGLNPQISDRLEPATPPTAAELKAYEGAYTSDDLNGTYTIAANANSLTVRISGRGAVTLEPVFKDTFAGDMFGIVRFDRSIHGFTASSDAARNLSFEKAKR